ncbi:hypothetical protein [Streptomyces niveus]|uniref:hypothetical protein n=1 Tax=Streptomyces niveus TaxID=193462 RepID=UPI003425869D
MSGRPVPRPPRPQPPAIRSNVAKRDYNLPRWHDTGKLGDKDSLRRATEVSSGHQDIGKHL